MEEEEAYLPHIIMTSYVDWDPTTDYLKICLSSMSRFYDVKQDDVHLSLSNSFGQYRHRAIATLTVLMENRFFDVYE
jgi:hypothetical protein